MLQLVSWLPPANPNERQLSTEAGDYDGMPRRGNSKLSRGLHLQPRRLTEEVKQYVLELHTRQLLIRSSVSSYVDACCVHTPSTSTQDGTKEETQAGYPFGGAAEPRIANFEVQAGNTEAICSAHVTNLSA